MIAHECSPGLPTDAFWASLPHILLDAPFTHANIQFEKFATDTLCSPESVVGCHLLNQGNRLGRKLWLSHTPSFCVSRRDEKAPDANAAASLAGQGRGPVSKLGPSLPGTSK